MYNFNEWMNTIGRALQLAECIGEAWYERGRKHIGTGFIRIATSA